MSIQPTRALQVIETFKASLPQAVKAWKQAPLAKACGLSHLLLRTSRGSIDRKQPLSPNSVLVQPCIKHLA